MRAELKISRNDCASVIDVFLKISLSILSCTLSLSTDSPQSVTSFEISDRQNHLLRMALNERVLRHTCGDVCDNADVCTWKQIECTDGIVTSMWASDQLRKAGEWYEIQMEWLPPTLQFIHLYAIRIPNLWKFMCLPRDLKYLYLRICNDWCQPKAQIDFARLPQKMEELLVINSNIGGTIRFDGLPETMRFVYIRILLDSVSLILVDYDRLPVALERLHVSNYASVDVKMKKIGKPRGVRLQTKYRRGILEEESKYVDTFYRKFSDGKSLRVKA